MDNQSYKVELKELNISELKDLASYIESLIRKKEYESKERIANNIKNVLKVKDIIYVTGNKFKGELFEVIKINIKKAKCKRENGEIWNIPFSHILTS